jgi:hypothetical protein
MKIRNRLGEVLITEDEYEGMIENYKDYEIKKFDPVPVLKLTIPKDNTLF